MATFENKDNLNLRDSEKNNVTERKALDRPIPCEGMEGSFFYYRHDRWHTLDTERRGRVKLTETDVEEAIQDPQFAHNPAKVEDPYFDMKIGS